MHTTNDLPRCSWARGELLATYHDNEWGVPTQDENRLYELLLLEAFQAGLSWQVILSKRDNFRRAFDNFQAHQIARYGEDKIDALMKDAGIVRCRRKIEGAILNAQVYLDICREYGSFAAYLYSFTEDGKPVVNHGAPVTTSPISDRMSADLRKRGMKYMGSVTVYSYLQAIGLVDDHEAHCFRRSPVEGQHV
ncbi:MAG: DNA-3-methyladenine glycosylase I [Clostridiales bacterium]|nr:DNA-3-methyladenine glycosylase I [Clostridiales bacterium]